MKRPLLLLAVSCCVVACSGPDAPADIAAPVVQPVAMPTGNGADKAVAATRLTIYSGDYDALAAGTRVGDPSATPGYALVDSRLHYALKSGANVITLSRLPRALDAAAVALQPEGGDVRIDGQRYIAPPRGAQAVLDSAIGQRVAVEHTSGGAKQTDNGVLVAAGNGLTLALGDGRTKVIREYDNFSLLDPDRQSVSEPTLRWQVNAPAAGDAAFALSYPTGGLAWRAEYRAVLGRGKGCTLALDGAALVANHSGMAWPDVALTLVAGEPERVRAPESPEVMSYSARSVEVAQAAADAAAAGGDLQAQASGEYYAYPLPGKATLASNAIERVPLFARIPGIACERAYETAPALEAWSPPRPLLDAGFNQDTGPQPVRSMVSFNNDKASGLGQPLPAGRVRVFDGDDFLGESRLDHTPVGAELHMDVGTTFDLSATRTRTDFSIDRGARTLRESFEVTLANAGASDATIVAIEPLPRWSDWQVVESSVPATRRDAQHARFEVGVPAGGKTTLRYTVRYRWPEGMHP